MWRHLVQHDPPHTSNQGNSKGFYQNVQQSTALPTITGLIVPFGNIRCIESYRSPSPMIIWPVFMVRRVKCTRNDHKGFLSTVIYIFNYRGPFVLCVTIHRYDTFCRKSDNNCYYRYIIFLIRGSFSIIFYKGVVHSIFFSS